MSGDAAGRTILVVDDSPQDLLLITKALEKGGCKGLIETALSADAAIARIQEGEPPALVFLDLQMPVKDGFALLRWLRARPEDWHRVPVVVFTTSQDELDIRRAYDVGANSFLVKPTGFEELRDTLASACAYWLTHNRSI